MTDKEFKEKAEKIRESTDKSSDRYFSLITDLYFSYVLEAKMPEEKARRRHNFKCGGRNIT